MDEFQPTEETRTDVFVELEAGPWWVCLLLVLAGLALLVVRRRVRGRTARRMTTALGTLLLALGLAGAVLAITGPVEL